MPRNYQTEIARDIPKDVYMEVMWKINGYERRRRERENILFASTSRDGQPKSSGMGDPTANAATRLAMLSESVEAIDKAMHDMNALYTCKMKRDDTGQFDALGAFNDYGAFCYFMHNPKNGMQSVYRTWNRFRSAFIKKLQKI